MAHILPGDMLETCDDGLFICLAKWASSVTTGVFWSLMLMGFAIVMYMATQKFGSSRAFSFSGVILLLGSIFLVIMNLIPWWIASLYIIVGAIALGSRILSEQ